MPEPQRFYLAALCARQARRGDESQAAFRQLGDHPISAPLMAYALSILPPAVDAPLQRLRDTLQVEHRWDPILFADAWTAGSGGQLRPTGETILRQIQCREFELLLSWLYEQATGQKLGHRRTAESDDASVLRARQRERRLKEMRRRREEAARRHQANTTGVRAKAKDHGDDSRSTSPAAPDARPPAGLRIRCPKCNGVLTVPLASRGKAARCGQCRAGFIVPSGGESSENVIGIICPQCSKRLTFTSAARGKKAQCMHCAVVFVVPPAPASATPKS